MFVPLIKAKFKLRNTFDIEPFISYQIKKINMDRFSNEELDDYAKKIANQVSRMLGRYKVITFGKRGRIYYPELSDMKKNRFLRKMENWVNNNWNIREIKSFLLAEKPNKYLDGLDWLERVDENEYLKYLRYFLNGNDEFVNDKIDFWDYGIKVGNKYGYCLIDYRVLDRAYPFYNDWINYIPIDFIHVIDFETMFSQEAEMKLTQMITAFEKANEPAEVITELQEFRNKLILKQANVMRYSQFIYLFHEDLEILLEVVNNIRNTLFTYNAEGDIEPEMIHLIGRWGQLNKYSNLGVVRTVTSDYLSTLIPITKRFEGVPEGRFIPLINEIGEPAYIPIASDLFNVGMQGQMGAGKSVAIQYLATMFDMVVFIEKIQSDVGSYAVFTKYFDGTYLPISTDSPVSIAPFARAVDYYMPSLLRILKYAGVENPHEVYDDRETDAGKRLLQEWYIERWIEDNKMPTEVDARTLAELFSKDDVTIRLQRFFESLAAKNDAYKVELEVNGTKKVFINSILKFMLKGEDERVDARTSAILEKVIDEFYKEMLASNPLHQIVMSDIYKFLKERLRRGEDDSEEDRKVIEYMIDRFYSYTNEGKYPNLFDMPTNIRETNNIFFEIRINDNELVPIIIMSIIDYINNTFGSSKYKKKSKLVVIDEGWFFMANEMAKSFIEEAFRTYRKRGIGIAFGTQNPRDYKTMLNYIPYKWILYLENPREAVDVYELGERDLALLKTIDKPKAYNYKFSKQYVIFKDALGKTDKGLFLMPAYPEFRWIAETDPVFKLKREEAVLKAGSLEKAIEMLAFET
ncbi:MAG: hypothetical protein JHC31_04360 [Sulfurihydrogenibium sp.]|jgi:hypothetical protein|nr:hypothetical protein [Sulfurihydrogenibium sp.]